MGVRTGLCFLQLTPPNAALYRGGKVHRASTQGSSFPHFWSLPQHARVHSPGPGFSSLTVRLQTWYPFIVPSLSDITNACFPLIFVFLLLFPLPLFSRTFKRHRLLLIPGQPYPGQMLTGTPRGPEASTQTSYLLEQQVLRGFPPRSIYYLGADIPRTITPKPWL